MRQPFLPHKNAHARDIGKWNQADGAGLRYLLSMISLLSLSWTFLYKTFGVVVSESIYCIYIYPRSSLSPVCNYSFSGKTIPVGCGVTSITSETRRLLNNYGSWVVFPPPPAPHICYEAKGVASVVSGLGWSSSRSETFGVFFSFFAYLPALMR